jgi:hypothetical protein
MNTGTRTPKRSLSRKQSFQVVAWLQEKHKTITSMDRATAAEVIQNDTGINLSPQSLKGIIKDAGMDIKFKRLPQKKTITDTFHRDAILSKAIIQIARELDIELQQQPNLSAIIRRKSSEIDLDLP